MNPAGALKIGATFVGGSIRVDALVLERPPLTRLFVGQNPDAAVRLIPHLYALCGEAQRVTARAALAAAESRSIVCDATDNRLLWLEMLHENLWRLLLDWPLACGLPAAREAFASWRSDRLGIDGNGATRRLIEETLCPLVERCRIILDDRGVAPTWAQLDAAAWLAWWREPSRERPEIASTGDIAAAYLARVADVARAAAALEAGQAFPLAATGGDGLGVAQTLTARGVLTHAIALRDGKVARYHLEAPTDASFAGPAKLAALLADRPQATAEAARRSLEAAILALDPCLPYEVEWKNA